MWTRLRNKLRYLLRPGRIDRDLAEELEIHRDMLREDEERRGASHGAAALTARRRMGNTTLMVEYSRDAWVVAWLDTLVRDVRYALRSFRRSPGFTVTALVTLALGIGANTAIFTILNSVILRPLPYADPGRLVMVWGLNERQGALRPSGLIEGDAFDIRRQARSFAQFEAFQANLVPIAMRIGANAFTAQAVSVTPGTFALLGRQPILGRTLQDGDRFTIVLGYGYWQRQFGGDSNVVGTQVTVRDDAGDDRGRDAARLRIPLSIDAPGVGQLHARRRRRPVGADDAAAAARQRLAADHRRGGAARARRVGAAGPRRRRRDRPAAGGRLSGDQRRLGCDRRAAARSGGGRRPSRPAAARGRRRAGAADGVRQRGEPAACAERARGSARWRSARRSGRREGACCARR